MILLALYHGGADTNILAILIFFTRNAILPISVRFSDLSQLIAYRAGNVVSDRCINFEKLKSHALCFFRLKNFSTPKNLDRMPK